VWVPFTSEAKEAVAHYDDLMREMRLAVQECGRKLGQHLRARDRLLSEERRMSVFVKYIPEVAEALSDILGGSTSAIKDAFNATLPRFTNVKPREEAAS
jgi:DNA topoisomerase-6 subunit B